MIKTYGFFDKHKKIETRIDDEKTVAELVEKVCAEQNFKQGIIDCVTVYDMNNNHLVKDKKKKIKSEIINQSLCFAYYVPKKFLYVEGGWCNHIKVFEGAETIRKPLLFGYTLGRVTEHECMLCASNMKFEEFLNGLIKGGYVKNPRTVSVYIADMYKFNHECVFSDGIENVIRAKKTMKDVVSENQVIVISGGVSRA